LFSSKSINASPVAENTPKAGSLQDFGAEFSAVMSFPGGLRVFENFSMQGWDLSLNRCDALASHKIRYTFGRKFVPLCIKVLKIWRYIDILHSDLHMSGRLLSVRVRSSI
jgi:hypothetical protein